MVGGLGGTNDGSRRFSDIHQAAAALAPIRAALPQATVGLPIIVNVDKPR